MNEDELYRGLLKTIRPIPRPATDEPRSILDYRRLVRTETWRQAWDADSRTVGDVHDVRGSIYSDAIEQCLEQNRSVSIPRMAEPVYIDRPIVLRSGHRLVVHPATEIRLIGCKAGTCIVRNANIVFAQAHPITPCEGADTDILIEGGIWSDQKNEGRGRGGAYDLEGSMPGSRAAFLLHNVAGITVRNAIFRDCSAFAIQLGNAADFVIEGIAFDETADGIHIEGPSERGILRRIAGKTNDDAVALNAWDWDNSSITFGPITDMLVEDVELRPGYVFSEIRLLSGTKVFPDGARLDCDIRRCVFRNIRGIHTFKLYDQPNLSKPEEDFADPIGKMSELFFSDIVVDGIRQSDYYDKSSDGVFDTCADIDGISIRNVRFNYLPGEDDMIPYLVSVGPKSLTWARGDGWIEVFNPNANPVVTALRIDDVTLPSADAAGAFVPCDTVAELVHERCLSLNPDFPRSMPRGGTGRGRIRGAMVATEVADQHALIGNVTDEREYERTGHPDAQWFGNAGLGLFIHWGLSSVRGQCDLSWGMMKGPEGGVARNIKVHGLPAVRASMTPATYWEQAKQFNPANYDPGKWLRAAKEAGVRYAVLTTRHHEGFALWPSEYGDLNTKTYMGGRDLLADYVQACRDSDIKVGFYYSPPDWYWNRETMSFGRGLDTPLGIHHEPVTLPEFSAEEQAERGQQYSAYVRGQVTELLTRYGTIDILWFDGSLPEKEKTISMEEIHALQPGILINPRGHGYGDFKTPECRFPEQPYDKDEWWELCYVFADGAWGYLNHECYKPIGWLLSELSRVRAWGGNFLPNVGPNGDGELPHNYYRRMAEIKAWMAHSGESVRNTRRGVWPERCNVPVTASDSAWYLHIDWAWDAEVVLQDVERPARLVYLRTGEEIPYSYEQRTVRFFFPENSKTIETDVVKIAWARDVQGTARSG